MEGDREFVRKRRDSQGSNLRPRKIEIRATERVSNKFASIQGLIFRYGKKETIADLFENICIPALEEYVKPYAEKAKADRVAGLQEPENAKQEVKPPAAGGLVGGTKLTMFEFDSNGNIVRKGGGV